MIKLKPVDHLEWTDCNPDEVKVIQEEISLAIEDIKERRYKQAVEKLFTIANNLRVKRKNPPPFIYDMYWEDGDNAAPLNRILRGDFNDSWEDYYELLKEMGNMKYFKEVSYYWEGNIPSFLTDLMETLIIEGRLEHAEILCSHVGILVDTAMVLEALGLSKKYREQLETKTNEFEEKLLQLDRENKLNIEKAKKTVEENLRKHIEKEESNALIENTQALPDMHNFLISGEAFIDFCRGESESGVDYSGPCLYYFKAIETYLPKRLVEILKPNVVISYRDALGYIEIEPKDSHFENMTIREYQTIIEEILQDGAPFSKSIIQSLTRWRIDFRNSRVHREPVSEFDDVIKIRGECYNLLGVIFMALKVKNVKKKYAKLS